MQGELSEPEVNILSVLCVLTVDYLDCVMCSTDDDDQGHNITVTLATQITLTTYVEIFLKRKKEASP